MPTRIFCLALGLAGVPFLWAPSTSVNSFAESKLDAAGAEYGSAVVYNLEVPSASAYGVTDGSVFAHNSSSNLPSALGIDQLPREGLTRRLFVCGAVSVVTVTALPGCASVLPGSLPNLATKSNDDIVRELNGTGRIRVWVGRGLTGNEQWTVEKPEGVSNADFAKTLQDILNYSYPPWPLQEALEDAMGGYPPQLIPKQAPLDLKWRR